MKLVYLTLIGTLLAAGPLFSMGEDEPGPNGGHITMPGTYHIELVNKELIIRVYLLDLSMKNPLVENSSVTLKFLDNKIPEIQCKPQNKYFLCNKPKNLLNNQKQIIVESVRNKVKGKIAIYKWPLSF